MAEPFNFELTLTDFLKYMPEAKRHDYELMLRRCNFSDPADPMFPVMLFLLFFQDNLAFPVCKDFQRRALPDPQGPPYLLRNDHPAQVVDPSHDSSCLLSRSAKPPQIRASHSAQNSR